MFGNTCSGNKIESKEIFYVPVDDYKKYLLFFILNLILLHKIIVSGKFIVFYAGFGL